MGNLDIVSTVVEERKRKEQSISPSASNISNSNKGEQMKFIYLVKFKKKVTRDDIAQNLKLSEKEAINEGVRMIDAYWTLGRYEAVVIMDAPDEKAIMRTLLRRQDSMTVETLVAIPAVDARKLVE